MDQRLQDPSGTAPPDYRALCAELLVELENVIAVHHGEGGTHHISAADSVIDRARAALAAEPDGPDVPEGREPASVVGEPSDEELLALVPQGSESDFYLPQGLPSNWVDGDFIAPPEAVVAFARAVLARFGHQPAPAAEGEQRHPAPVPVSERLPGPEDCDAEGMCWLFSKVEKEWRLIDAANPGVPRLKYFFSHWLPATALPLPQGEAQP